MTIKIKGLELQKDTTKVKVTSTEETRTLIGLEGELELEVSHGQFKGQDFYNLSKVSESLKSKLYDVLTEIEKELENKESIKISSGIIQGVKIDIGEATVKIPKGERIIPKSDAEKLLKQLDVEKGKLESIKKQKEELEEKIHSHNADKDESDDIGKLLDEAGKIFNVVFNVNGETKKSAQDLVKDMAKEMRTRGMWK